MRRRRRGGTVVVLGGFEAIYRNEGMGWYHKAVQHSNYTYKKDKKEGKAHFERKIIKDFGFALLPSVFCPQIMDTAFADTAFADALLEQLLQFPTSLDFAQIPLPLTKTPQNVFFVEEDTLGIDIFMLPTLARAFRASHEKVRTAPLNPTDSENASYFSTLYKATTALLLLCPDNYTAWNDRKLVVSYLLNPSNKSSQDAKNDGQQSYKQNVVLKNELDFMNLLFTKFAKATNAWAHRKWVSQRFLELIDWSDEDEQRVMCFSHEDDVRLIVGWAEKELSSCNCVIGRYPKNYYAYTHKLWAMKQVGGIVEGEKIIFNLDCLVERFFEKELGCCEEWLTRNISDYSAVSYLNQLLEFVYGLRFVSAEKRQGMIMENMARAKRMVNLYEGLDCECFHLWRRLSAVSFLRWVEESSEIDKDKFLADGLEGEDNITEGRGKGGNNGGRNRHSYAYVCWVIRVALNLNMNLNMNLDWKLDNVNLKTSLGEDRVGKMEDLLERYGGELRKKDEVIVPHLYKHIFY